MEINTNRIQALPKVDLHLHLDGSVKPETLIDIARESGATLPVWEPEKLAPYMKVKGECKSLAEYLDKFHFVGEFLHTATALERVAYELVSQANDQNCTYIEVRFAPQLHRNNGLSLDEVIQHVRNGLQRGEETFGVRARIIVICLRGHSEEMNAEAIEVAGRFLGKGVVAVDLAGAEAAFPPEQFEHIFSRAVELGLPITIHAGEALGAPSVEIAVNKLGATRIGHGVRMREDASVMELIKSKHIPLELCPISNIQTKAVDSWEDYPLRDYFDKGFLVTVNTDNLTVSDTTITKEYEMLQKHLHFTDEEICKLVMNGVNAAFLLGEEKDKLRSEMELKLSQWLKSYAPSTTA
ncbi:adenosine deaminase [Paenibacillus sp. GSMTC-2017]|uniref:adenosine deaminase n=1 Tax=Paenibacillus sp. GSMTC-2017 TaxID=2794350 RepID=UPI0018D9C1FC|nr:adenosine deaminase [Paenibacillus sp. GSMTC-2017]MBH5316529.1 adenosine deaminase [Paenibacillus sp. GSMTC-2017]